MNLPLDDTSVGYVSVTSKRSRASDSDASIDFLNRPQPPSRVAANSSARESSGPSGIHVLSELRVQLIRRAASEVEHPDLVRTGSGIEAIDGEQLSVRGHRRVDVGSNAAGGHTQVLSRPIYPHQPSVAQARRLVGDDTSVRYAEIACVYAVALDPVKSSARSPVTFDRELAGVEGLGKQRRVRTGEQQMPGCVPGVAALDVGDELRRAAIQRAGISPPLCDRSLSAVKRNRCPPGRNTGKE